MARPTYVHIDSAALLHNVNRVKQYAKGKKIIAMVKANAYGCGLSSIIPELEGHVDAFGVACLEEAMAVRALGSRSDCVLFQGVFSADELHLIARQRFQSVVHHKQQLEWILATPLTTKIKVWVKVNTGMHRLGFAPSEVTDIINALLACPWIDSDIKLMTHLACADEPERSDNLTQLRCFNNIDIPNMTMTRSIANSAAIISLPDAHADIVRPGIMLYGVSPLINQIGNDLHLIPVMHLISAVSVIRHYPPFARVGYGGTWQSDKPTTIGVVAIGYGDGYPRHIAAGTPTWVNGFVAPIVGRVSMDMLTIDLTNCPSVKEGDKVELWGKHIPVEIVAKSAGTIAYELMCRIAPRVRPEYSYLSLR